METVVLDGDPPITLVLRTSAAARRYSLRVSRLDGRVTLTMPRHASRRKGIAFATQKAEWIRRKLAEQAAPVPVGIGSSLPVDGVTVTLKRGAKNRLLLGQGCLEIAADAVPAAARTVLRAHARDRIAGAAAGFSRTLGRPFSGITLRDTRSRWGSCSARGALMFSWRLILAPPAVLDYVVAHEVAHLAEMNHGPRFWATVERLWPEYRVHRAWLRRHGEVLHSYRFGD
ncbi:M48 family metallopeptidase [Tropicimonas sp.]|uniref:M48 family metallopeptidase n=1 Tax=Tropicimonas sp. TaxID=2067044 RepID=UPI003A899759